MSVVRASMIGFVTLALVFTVAASHAAQPTVALPTADGSSHQTVSEAQSPQHAEIAIWATVPHCDCFTVGTTATTNVTNALKEANLAVSLKEFSPSNGLLYFVVNFDPESATRDQVISAIEAGGGELVDGPP